MTEGVNFYGIERADLTERGPDWTRTDIGGRGGRWLKSSEYHRLLRKERTQTWAVLLGALTPVAAALVYLLT